MWARRASRTGADDGTRTRNRRFTKPLLYQLSYVGAHGKPKPAGAPGDDRSPRENRSSALAARASRLRRVVRQEVARRRRFERIGGLERRRIRRAGTSPRRSRLPHGLRLDDRREGASGRILGRVVRRRLRNGGVPRARRGGVRTGIGL